jgi:hypothetical protein
LNPGPACVLCAWASLAAKPTAAQSAHALNFLRDSMALSSLSSLTDKRD